MARLTDSDGERKKALSAGGQLSPSAAARVFAAASAGPLSKAENARPSSNNISFAGARATRAIFPAGDERRSSDEKSPRFRGNFWAARARIAPASALRLSPVTMRFPPRTYSLAARQVLITKFVPRPGRRGVLLFSGPVSRSNWRLLGLFWFGFHLNFGKRNRAVALL